MNRKLKKLEEEQRRLMREIDELNGKTKKSSSASLTQFIVGLVLLGVGLFWIFQSVHVSSGIGSFFYIGGWSVPNGTVIVPLLIGIAMLFVMDRKIYGWIVTGIGVAVILAAIITSVRLSFHGGSLFNYILMFGFAIVGGALVLKNILKK